MDFNEKVGRDKNYFVKTKLIESSCLIPRKNKNQCTKLLTSAHIAASLYI